MTRELLLSLYHHMAWANELVLQSLTDSPGSDRSALEQFAHVLAAEHVWLTRITGEPARVAVWPALSTEQCARLAAENHSGFMKLLSGASEDELVREVDYVNSAGRSFRSRLLDILVHVAMHGSYHRGMTSLITRRSRGTPAPTDYIAFIRGAPTATRADTQAKPR